MYRILFMAILFSGSALAAELKSPSLDLSKGNFAAQRSSIEALLQDKDYKEITPEQVQTLHGDFDAIQVLIGSSAGVDGLPAPQKQQALDIQFKINDILATAATESHVSCRSETVIGSNIPKRICRSVAERRRVRLDAQQAMRGVQGARSSDIRGN